MLKPRVCRILVTFSNSAVGKPEFRDAVKAAAAVAGYEAEVDYFDLQVGVDLADFHQHQDVLEKIDCQYHDAGITSPSGFVLPIEGGAPASGLMR